MRKHYLLIFICLLISLFIYLFYRTEHTLVNTMAAHLISGDHYSRLREIIAGNLALPDIIIYSVPEGLWVFCITLTSQPFYVSLFRLKINCVLVPIGFSVVLELFQLFNITNGRFDMMDIAVSLFFWAVALSFFSYTAEKKDLFKSRDKKRIACFASYAIVYLSHVLQ